MKTLLQIDSMGVASEIATGNYTPIILLALGIAGILLHNLIKMDKINREVKGDFNYGKYLALEKFSIAISVIVVIASVIIRGEIQELEQAGKWLGFAFVAIGYLSQSILVSVMGRTDAKIKSAAGVISEQNNPTNENNGA